MTARRDRATDRFGVVHFAAGTKAYLDTGRVWVKTLCGTETPVVEKTSKQIPITCLACIHVVERVWFPRTHVPKVRRR